MAFRSVVRKKISPPAPNSGRWPTTFGNCRGGVLGLPSFRDSGDGESLGRIWGSAEPRQFGRERFTRLVQGRELLQDSLFELVGELPEIVIKVRRHDAHTGGLLRSVEAGVQKDAGLGTFDRLR